MKAWDELDAFERLAVALYYGKQRYIREYMAEQEKYQKMMTTVDNTLFACERAFRRHRGKK